MDSEREALLKLAAKLMLNELVPRLKKRGVTADKSPITPEKFGLGVLAVYCGAWDTHYFRMKLDEVFNAQDS